MALNFIEFEINLLSNADVLTLKKENVSPSAHRLFFPPS